MSLIIRAHSFQLNKLDVAIMILVLFSILAGKYAEALELAKLALKWEEKELGKRPERMVELYGLLTDIYDEVCTAKVSLLHFLFCYLQS